MLTSVYHSPIGPLTLAADEQGLRHIIFRQGSRAFDTPSEWQPDASAFDNVQHQLEEYFKGIRQSFSLKLAPHGTAFQKRVWGVLQSIPYNETCSYGDIAKRLGKPSASRAVGAANGANPLPIVIPCHRVIGSNGSLTGFGGGIPTKQWLLCHERGEGQLFFS